MEEEETVQTNVPTETKIQRNMFCSKKGLIGLFLIAIGSVGHFLTLPFADLTLIACNSSSAVLINMIISYKHLGEKFVPRYDITAMFLVAIGTLAIIMTSNKE